MGFVKAALDDVAEPEVVAEGEYDLRIVKSEDKESRAGNPMTEIFIRIEDAGSKNPALVAHYLNHVTPETPKDQQQMRLLETKRFLQVFGVAHTPEGFDTDDLQGATGRCLLIQEEGKDGVTRNRMKLPRLKE